MTEKLRSLLSRQQPRDFYDLWYLSECENLEMSDYIVEFEAKAKHKRLNPDSLENRLDQLLPVFKVRWEKSMSEQIKDLPLNEQGKRVYPQNYTWTGNFQENLCTVRNFENHYFHINLQSNRIYSENYLYAGDFKDGIACVKLQSGVFKHIDKSGKFINDKDFLDLDVFHKNFATAKDKNGWFHIYKNGNELYCQRYSAVEPFYNGFALVMQFDENKVIINEQGKVTHKI